MKMPVIFAKEIDNADQNETAHVRERNGRFTDFSCREASFISQFYVLYMCSKTSLNFCGCIVQIKQQQHQQNYFKEDK